MNAANFATTSANVRHGTALSRLLDGRRSVIDTSRNGNGPAPAGPSAAPRPRSLRSRGRTRFLSPPYRGHPNRRRIDSMNWCTVAASEGTSRSRMLLARSMSFRMLLCLHPSARVYLWPYVPLPSEASHSRSTPVGWSVGSSSITMIE
ncbi:hypothetical protein I0C86_26715 [Plantactinospora sp. S1510]|uniref:Uncharacterized protein n=1 Tax=Plantactinospora alkalitolerans TaxID=2789879 RepID=A0ABS0H233_9ACTN|nr:hypothetical protein [Plantactinospora alkalitolerans]